MQFKTNSENLIGEIIQPGSSTVVNKPTILFLHGAGASDRNRIRYLAEPLAKIGFSSFTFDFSGHGESSGKLSESSLEKRVEEATEALQFLNASKPITLVGSSMGAYIALKLLENPSITVKNLILFCPAIYSKDAYSVPFDQKFSAVIRQPNSWKNTDVFYPLKKFKGHLLIVIGEKDAVIPKEVVSSLIDEATHVKSKKLVVVPNATHQLHTWLSSHQNDQTKVLHEILTLLS